jgi:intergrase/recombinase
MYVVEVRIHLQNKLIAYGIDLNLVSFAAVRKKTRVMDARI